MFLFFCCSSYQTTSFREFGASYHGLPLPRACCATAPRLDMTPQLTSIDIKRGRGPCVSLRVLAQPRVGARDPTRGGTCASLKSSCGCLQRRRAAPPSRHRAGKAHRRRAACSRGSAAAGRHKRSAASQGSFLGLLLGSTTGLPVRGACATLFFRQDKK